MTTQPETTTTNSKRPRGFIHSPNSSADLRVAGLRRLGGWEWYGIYIAMLEVLFDSSDLHISRSRLEDVAFSLRVAGDTLEKIVAVCLESGALLEDAKGIYSPDLVDDVSQFEIKREKFVKAARARYQKPATHGERESVAPAMHMQRSEDACRSHEYDTDTEYETETEIRSEAKEPTAPARASEEVAADPYVARADKHLRPVDGGEWQNDSRFMGAGRRPMRNYPEIWLTEYDLANVIQSYEKSLPEPEWKACFLRCEAQLKGMNEGERRRAHPLKWLLGFLLTEQIAKATQQQRAKNSGVVLQGPRPRAAAPPVQREEPPVSREKAKEILDKLTGKTSCGKSIQ